MKRIYLIRHGAPDVPEGVRMCLGRTDIPLGETGRRQARRTAENFPPVTAVYSSPLSRCTQTAACFGMPVTILEGLRELDAGLWDGLTFDVIRQRYPEHYAARGQNPALRPPEGESQAHGVARFRCALETAVRSAPGDCAIVTHGGITAAFLEALTGTWQKPGYTEVVTLVWDAGRFVVV